MLSLEKGGVRVELEDIGEGYDGEYNPDDPHDTPLLRFTVLHRTEAGDWEQVDDASYCTQLPVNLSEDKQIEVLKIIMGEVYGPAADGFSIKKMCERLSWLGEHDLDPVGRETA